jgi:hypothetical protein
MTPDENGYSPLQVFECTAIPAAGIPLRATPSTWSADGPIVAVHQLIAGGPELVRSAREVELTRLPSAELRDLVDRQGATLPIEDLVIIERIAHERVLARGTDCDQSAQLLAVVAKLIAARPR